MRVMFAAGQRIEVGIGNRFEDRPRTVRLDVPVRTELTPDGARTLAVALIEHAAEAENRRSVR